MPVIKQEFRPFLSINPVTKEIESTYQPKITIFIKINGMLYPFKIDAYVDSGATRNLFPADILKSLHIELDNGKKRIHFGIGDKEVVSYVHKAEILVGDLTIKTEIDFSQEHKPHLLGTDQFFDFFDSVNFNMERAQLELHYTSKKN